MLADVQLQVLDAAAGGEEVDEVYYDDNSKRLP
jgi:hypothetical protein